MATGKEISNPFMAGVNPLRCDEDRLELMVFLLPSDEKVGIQTSVAVKKVNDVTRLQALVDKKKVVITEASIRDALRLDDAEGIECLPNEEIFAEVGKRFSGVETPLLEGMIVEQQVAEGADEGVPTAGIVAEGDVSAANDEVPTAVEEPSIASPTPPTPPPQPLQDQPLTSQVHLTPPLSPQAQPQSPQHQPQPLQDVGLPIDLLQNPMDTCTTLTRRVKNLEQDKIAQALEITKLKSRVKKLERRNKASMCKRLKKVGSAQRIETSDDTVMDDVSKQRRMIADMDADVDVTLEDAKEFAVEKSANVDESADVQGKKADAARRKKGIVIKDPQETITPSIIIHSEAKSKDKGKGILVEEPKPLKKQAQIKQDEAYTRELEAQLNKNIDWDEVIVHVQRKKKEDDAIKALKRMNESQEDKAAKKQKLDEEVEELKRHLQIVPNEEDDVYTKATPLDLKVPVIDYEIYNEHNKPYIKIKRADGSHQLYLSFLCMLRNFDREDLEAVWRLVKERFDTTKPKNFFDDFCRKHLELCLKSQIYMLKSGKIKEVFMVKRREKISTYKVHSGSDA
nr:hypothetical protein [Tanacetum cinerariifolium]